MTERITFIIFIFVAVKLEIQICSAETAEKEAKFAKNIFLSVLCEFA
jgi:hypothetical protein